MDEFVCKLGCRLLYVRDDEKRGKSLAFFETTKFQTVSLSAKLAANRNGLCRETRECRATVCRSSCMVVHVSEPKLTRFKKDKSTQCSIRLIDIHQHYSFLIVHVSIDPTAKLRGYNRIFKSNKLAERDQRKTLLLLLSNLKKNTKQDSIFFVCVCLFSTNVKYCSKHKNDYCETHISKDGGFSRVFKCRSH